ncbi:MAG: DUF502 domain-containing protein [Bacteroidia bacterium]|nr:MAG: DUF502 domain-containing protein [Bacteroidia bacterium]
MKPSLIKRAKNFLRTTLLGGLAAILPLALVIILFKWIGSLIQRYLEPLVNLIETDTRLKLIILYILAFIAVLFLFFLIGLLITTRMGRFFNNVLEEKYLLKIPGYKIARDTVMQFFGKNRSFFNEVVLVDIFASGTLMTGFITDDKGEYITVFVPTGPNPTSGNIYHVTRDRITKTTAPVEAGMQSIISCGSGSSEIFACKIPG